MLYYQGLIKKLNNFSIDQQTAFRRIKDFTLDEVYCDLLNTQTELRKVRRFLTETGAISDSEFSRTLAYTDTQLDRIIGFFEDWFDQSPFIGNEAVWQQPDIVVILGANPSTRNLRTQEAASYLKKHPEAAVVLSGGGFSAAMTEAEFMQKDLLKAGVVNQLFLEKDSMDTISNALFSKFLLKSQQMLVEGSKILIVTSRFHTMRALFYFQQLFGRQTVFAVHGVKTTTPTTVQDRAVHELVSQHNSLHSLGIFDQNMPQDDQDILLKLFNRHALYQNRDDLIRKFLRLSSS